MTARVWIQLWLPILVLITCVCGVLLVLGFISGGILAGTAVLIPIVVLGGLSGLGVITGTVASGCMRSGNDTDDSQTSRLFMTNSHRPSRSTIRRRTEIVGRLPHSERALLDLPQDERACSICLNETPYERVLLNCHHMFHESCINEWLARARYARCPLCRSGITVQPQQPIGDMSPLHQDTNSFNNVPTSSPV